MTFLPIVERELRVAARRRGTYLQRLAGAVVSLGVGGWIMLAAHNEAPVQLGGFLFMALSLLLFVYGISAGARMTADCLSEEKREGTLGLLFLTDLKGYDIVSGKLAANSLNTLYGLLSAFPVLAVPLLMGGVTSTEFWRVSLVAVNLLFFSLAVGMFASSICREERRAITLAFLILLLFLGAPPLIEMFFSFAHQYHPWRKPVLIFSPGFACFAAFGKKINISPREFWLSTALTHLYAWLFLALASFIVPRSWQDKPVKASSPSSSFWQRFLAPDQKKENALRAKLLHRNPFLWLAARQRVKAWAVWAMIFLLTILWLLGWRKWPDDWMELPNYLMTAVALHTLLKYWLASEACHRFVQDRKSGALELLLSTPLQVTEIFRGQRLALLRQFGGPVVFVLAVDAIFIFLSLTNREVDQGNDGGFWLMIWLAGMTVFLMDLLALSWVSMWLGMSAAKINRASASAITRIMVLPWLAFLLSLTLWATLTILARPGWNEKVVLGYWFALCVLNNIVFTVWAKKNLHTRFREIATQRFEARKRFSWGRTASKTARAELPPVILSR